ncbi:nucleoporin nup35 [Anaeramoeba ignava]|uniref:Nucleoporin nup35 n=1 Tax=Anaeramoeba ignava TaxID=1746090 RepID=A0A9Q0RAI4_ANAIG|nr:nucleoporin nup35 [Anaeramoeba ignava]
MQFTRQGFSHKPNELTQQHGASPQKTTYVPSFLAPFSPQVESQQKPLQQQQTPFLNKIKGNPNNKTPLHTPLDIPKTNFPTNPRPISSNRLIKSSLKKMSPPPTKSVYDEMEESNQNDFFFSNSKNSMRSTPINPMRNIHEKFMDTDDSEMNNFSPQTNFNSNLRSQNFDSFINQNENDNENDNENENDNDNTNLTQNQIYDMNQDDSDTWIVVFGINGNEIENILQFIQQFWQLEDYLPGEGNWIRIKFTNSKSAYLALQKGFLLLDSSTIIGFAPLDILSQIQQNNQPLIEPFSQQKPNHFSNNQNNQQIYKQNKTAQKKDKGKGKGIIETIADIFFGV